MKKIIFITSTSENPLFIKRVNEFIEQGYEVEAYAFVRGGKTNREANYQTHSLGELLEHIAEMMSFFILWDWMLP